MNIIGRVSLSFALLTLAIMAVPRPPTLGAVMFGIFLFVFCFFGGDE